MNFLNSSGQATVEYVLIFAFMGMMSLGIVRAIGGGLSTSVGTLAYALTQELSTGVCKDNCFYSGFVNE